MSRKLTKRMRATLTAVLAAFMIVCLPTLSGCLETDVIVEYVLDQNSENVDYDNPTKIYIPDVQSSTYIEDLPNVQAEQDEELQETEQETPQRSEEEQTVDDQTNDTAYSQNQSTNTQTGTPNISDDAELPSESGTQTGSDEDTSGTDPDEDPEEGQGDSNLDGDMSARPTRENNVIDASWGLSENLPTDVDTIAAYGNTATAVLVIGGDGHLVASSSEYLSDSGVQTVFGSRLSGVAALWSGDGTAAGECDIDELIELRPDAVLVESGSNSISLADEQTLGDAGIYVIYVPQMTSETNILTTVNVLGTILSEKTENASVERAEEYQSFVDEVTQVAKNAHGGGLATYNGIDYNTGESTLDTSSTVQWSLYVSGWDADATVTAIFSNAPLYSDTGVAYTNCNYTSSPVSYYMSVGGVINNAAAYYGITTVDEHLFLTFNENQVTYTWQNLDISAGDEGGSGFGKGMKVLANAADYTDSDPHYLGSSDFNKVIVASESIRSALVAAMNNPLGLYTPGTYVRSPGGNTYAYGILTSDTIVYTYSILEEGQTSSYEVLVNPCGLVGSWADGSLESCLEAIWVASEFYDLSSSEVSSYVRTFYSEFYGYDLSDAELDRILSGDYYE